MCTDHKTTVHNPFYWPCAIFFVFVLLISPAVAQVSVVTANYGNARTNANLNETFLNPLNVNATQFGKLFSLPVGGSIN